MAMGVKIQISSDYDKFKMLPFNRDVKRTSYLEASMKRHGWIDAYPLHVVSNGDGTYKVKAGHHRLEVARELKIPIKFIICEDKASVYELEQASNRWTLMDYRDSFIRSEYPEYIKVKEYQEATGIGLSCAISMLVGLSAGSKGKDFAFKTGMYKVTDTTHANIVGDIIIHCRNIGIEWANLDLFVKAISRLARADGFDASRLKKKLSTYSYMVEKQVNIAAYQKMIEDIYNRQSADKVPLMFNADKAAHERRIMGKIIKT